VSYLAPVSEQIAAPRHVGFWPIASLCGNAANGRFRGDCVAKLKNELREKFRGASVEADTWGANTSQRAYEGCQWKTLLIM
jgi:hypothetical protein